MAKLLTGKKKSRTSPTLTAALAALGRKPDAVVASEETTDETETEVETETENGDESETQQPNPKPKTDAENKPAKETEAETPPVVQTPAPAADLTAANARIAELEASATTQTATHNGAITALRSQLSDANTELVTLRASAEVNRAALEASEAGATAMRAVCMTAISRLDLILGTESVGLDKLSHSEIVAHYNKLNTKFESKYPTGGKARTGADVTAKPEISPEPQDENERLLRRAANLTRGNK